MKPITTISKFRYECESSLRETSEAFKNFNWLDKAIYASWLAQTYFFVCHSTRFLATAAGRFTVSKDALHQRFLRHLGEEKSHEKMILSDLKTLGFNMENFQELPETKAFYERQYYLIEHIAPEVHFGYILCLELLAALHGHATYKIVSSEFGEKSSLFLKVHGEDDLDHIEKAFSEVEKLPAELQRFVLDNFKVSSRLYGSLLFATTQVANLKESSWAA